MIRLVIFDMDGTVTRPYPPFDEEMWMEGLDPGTGYLEYIQTLPGEERKRIRKALDRYEEEAARNAVLNDGFREVTAALREKGIPVALLTRNSRKSARTVMEKHELQFDAVLTREDAPPKPSPTPVESLCRRFGVECVEALLVGDMAFDIEAGRCAGVQTALLGTDSGERTRADYRIDHLKEIIPIVEAEE